MKRLVLLSTIAITAACGSDASTSLTEPPAPLVISTTSLPNATLTVAYSQTLVATGGSGGYTWSVLAGALPTGLTLSAATGVISGTPTGASSTFTVRVASGAGQTAQQALTITVTAAVPPLVITTTTLPNATLTVAYSQTLVATGGSGGYTWSVLAGALPTGLTLSAATGVISGTPTGASSTFTVRVASGAGQTAQQALTITVTAAVPPLVITTTTLPNATLMVPYSQTLQATGGSGGYNWYLAQGHPPAGLLLNGGTGVISGTPTGTGSTFTVGVLSGDGQAAQQVLTIVGGPASLTKTAGDGQTAAAGFQVAIRPEVTVRDSNGNLVRDAIVLFTVASGGGAVTGGTALSDGAGVATVGNWTLGATPGSNTLTASTAGVAAAVTFTATGTAGAPASLTKSAGDGQTGVTGSPVTIPPAVTVRDAGGYPVSGASVLFTVVSGGGLVTGGNAISDGAGVATVGSWTLGGGTNTLTASTAGVAAVTFSALGSAGIPASLTKTAGDGQTAEAGSPVNISPAVTVKDIHGNPVSGASVLFTVTGGGGSVTGGAAVSDGAGVATVGSWTIGGGSTNRLTASAGAVPSVTFSANGTCPLPTHTIGTTDNGTLSTFDCTMTAGQSGPYYIDFYQTTTDAKAVLFTQTSPDFNSYLYLLSWDFAWQTTRYVAENDTAPGSTGLNAAIKVLLPPGGTYLPLVSSRGVRAIGSYSLSSSLSSEEIANCEKVFSLRGLSTTQHITSSDCVDLSGPFYGDNINIYLEAGLPVTISQASASFSPWLELWTASGVRVATNTGATSTVVTYTPPSGTTGYYRIFATTAGYSATGLYTLTIQ